MTYRIIGLPIEPFSDLFGLADDELEARGARRCVADEIEAFPCRVSLEDADVGESLLLVNYTHQPADTPYRASHAIFVRESARVTAVATGQIPDVIRRRTISARVFSAEHMMVDAALCDGNDTEPLILRFLADPAVSYVHLHYAKRGCYAARVERA